MEGRVCEAPFAAVVFLCCSSCVQPCLQHCMLYTVVITSLYAVRFELITSLYAVRIELN